jgi:MFS family permease
MRYHLLVPVLSGSLLISWGSLYYAFGVLLPSMHQDLRYSGDVLTGAFSAGLLVWGLATYPVGLAMDRWGAHAVMMLGALIAAAGFLGLYAVSSVWMFYILWSALGMAMAMTLYEPAFALVVQSFSDGHKRRIGWLTVVGGFASTVFWPISYNLSEHFGWRHTMLAFAAMHVLVCVSLNSIHFPQIAQRPAPENKDGQDLSRPPLKSAHRSAFAHLSVCFAIYGFITAAMAVQAIPMLESLGFKPAAALSLASCIGPMQVGSRAIDLVFGRRVNARHVGIITLGLMSLSLAMLWLAQWLPTLSIVFVISYGLALGLLTVVRAAAPLELSGTERYASNSGILGTPSLIARAAGPLGSALLFEAFGNQGHVLVVLLLCSACGIWLYLRAWPGTWEAA